MKHALKTFFIGGEGFKKEFKKQVRFLIIITLGFTIAFTWRQTLFDLTEILVIWITNIQSKASLSILTSIVITLVSLGIIWVASKLLHD